MRAIITDPEAIGSLKPPSIVGYLRARGWRRYGDNSSNFSVWISDVYPDAEVVVPAKREASDFISRLTALLSELEAAEGRSQLDILRDLLNAGFDVIRLAAISAGTQDGSVRIADGVRLFHEAREIMMAAACSAVRPSAVFHSRKPPQAVDYINTARLGQTEHGSYVLTVLSPVAPQLNTYSDTDLFPEEPFGRQVVRTLSQGVALAVRAAEESSMAAAPDFSPFLNAVQGGVSANLCEAIAGLFGIGDTSEVHMSIAWAENRPQPENVKFPSKIRISNDVAPTIAEAARVFRSTDTLEGYSISGPVVKLERSDFSESGQVTILTLIEGVMRKVSVNLSSAEYERATEAHRDYRWVKMFGDIKKDGRSYKMFNVAGFDFAPDDPAV